jgi:hypothetical protein
MIKERYTTDCRRCRGLCCVAMAHAPANGFPSDKPANQACRHLSPDHRCQVFETLEDEGYTVCRAYECHGAGPVVSAWIDSDGAATPTARRLDDFQQLSRVHLLAMAVQGESPDLFEALDRVGDAYQREGVFTMTDTARAALTRNQDLVEAVLARLAPRPFV